MSIATEVERLAENLRNTRQAITEKGGTVASTAGLKDLPDAIASIPSDGGSGVDLLYYASQLSQTFYNVEFPENYAMTLRIKRLKRTYHTFMGATNLKKVKLIIEDKDAVVEFSNMFRECASIEEVDLTECNTSNFNEWSYSFFQTNGLKRILGDLDLSQATIGSYIFFASILEEVRIVPNTINISIRFNSAKLTQASIESIINGLADLTGKDPQTLTLNGVGRNLTEEQKARISAKNWTLAY